MPDGTDGLRSRLSGMPNRQARNLFEVVKPGFSSGQTILCFFYPVRRSHVLPETAETKTEKLLLARSMRG